MGSGIGPGRLSLCERVRTVGLGQSLFTTQGEGARRHGQATSDGARRRSRRRHPTSSLPDPSTGGIADL